MYRLATLFTILLISSQSFAADSRLERWNQRVDRLKKIQTAAASGRLERPVIDELAVSGIKSSEEFIAILGRYSSEDGSLKTGTKKYSLRDIEQRVQEISSPAVSVAILSGTYSSAENSKLKETISADLNAYIAKHTSGAVKIPLSDLNIMARDYILEAAAGEYDTAAKKLTSDILSKTVYELSRTDYNSSDADLTKIIARHAFDSVNGFRHPLYSGLNENYLASVPMWRFILSDSSRIQKRNSAIISFVKAGGGSLEANPMIRDAGTAEDEIFTKAKSRISHLLKTTTPSSGSTGNNPYYEIPDTGKLRLAVDEIDRYRHSMMRSVTGNESREFIKKIKGNSSGIAERQCSRIEAIFRNEEARIERLKKINGDAVIYNTEVFNAARSHFGEVKGEIIKYGNLSGDFLELYFTSGKTEPGEFKSLHKYKTERYLKYISFAEKLTSDARPLPVSGLDKLNSYYRGVLPAVLNSSKNLLKPEQIPQSARSSMTRDELKEYASINSGFRTDGLALLKAIRGNYDECAAGFSRNAAEKRVSDMESESRIAQDETDRLFSFAKRCSVIILSMNVTEKSLKTYSEVYTQTVESIRRGEKPAGIGGADNSQFSSSVNGFNPESIERETATRELIAKEGMESLSGAITLVQYYRRKGVSLNFEPTPQEIASIKLAFTRSPEVNVSSWRMNGKNFRQIDINVTAEIQKLINGSAWNGDLNSASSETVSVKGTGYSITFTPPQGWKKVSAQGNGDDDRVSYESPDKTGIIELTTIHEEEHNIQSLASAWPERSGFSMVEKNWGKKNESDYVKSVSKNSFNRVMESYMIASNGRVIILSGKTSRDMYRKLNKTLGEVFSNLEIKREPLKLSSK